MTKRLSSGFAGASIRSLDDMEREVESRLSKKRLDLFKDEFTHPGARETKPGLDYSKRKAPYAAPHDDISVTEQEVHDDLDQQEYAAEAGIKPIRDQFPGTLDDTEFEGDPGPEEFHKRVESRLKRMSASGYSQMFQTNTPAATSRAIGSDGATANFKTESDAERACVLLENAEGFKGIAMRQQSNGSYIVVCYFKPIEGVRLAASDNASFDSHQTDPAKLRGRK